MATIVKQERSGKFVVLIRRTHDQGVYIVERYNVSGSNESGHIYGGGVFYGPYPTLKGARRKYNDIKRMVAQWV